MKRRLPNRFFLLSMGLLSAFYAVCLTTVGIQGEEETFFSFLLVSFPVYLLLVGLSALLSALLMHYFMVRLLHQLDSSADDSKTDAELLPILEHERTIRLDAVRRAQELNRHRSELSAMLESMSEGMIALDCRAQILSINAGALRLLGAGAEVPKSVLMLCSDEGFRSAIREALNGKRGSCQLLDDNTCLSVIVAPVVHEEVISGAVVIILDDTEKERREALRREFTANVSHELKTPLTSISGFAELIAGKMTDEADTRRFAEKIHCEAQRMISLVGDIIRLSQLDGGEIPFDEETIDLAQVAAEVLSRFSGQAGKASVSLSLSSESTFVRGNSCIIDEMISNLCDNAIKYNRIGGHVWVVVTQKNGEPFLSVSDDGIGIPSDCIGRVFERFYRVDKSHSKEIGGTGLGLSIVKHAAVFLHARITLESEEGRGTTVSFFFPKTV